MLDSYFRIAYMLFLSALRIKTPKPARKTHRKKMRHKKIPYDSRDSTLSDKTAKFTKILQ